MRAMVNAHPRFYAPHGHQALIQLLLPDCPTDWNRLVQIVLSINTPELAALNLSRQELESQVPSRDGGGLWSYIHLKGMKRAGKQQLLVKQNRVWRYLPAILSWFPGARFLYQVRDPRAYINSCKNVHPLIIHYGSIAGALDVYEEDQRQSLEFFERLSKERALMQTYEELASSPQDCLTRFCHWAGTEFEPRMLEFYREASEQALARRYPGMWGHLAHPVTSKHVNKFRLRLRWYETGAIEYRLGSMMQRLGYRPDSSRDSAAERLLWRAFFRWDQLRSILANRVFRVLRRPFFSKLAERIFRERKPR